VVFLGQDIIFEYHRRIKGYDPEYFCGQTTGMQHFLKYPCEQEAFAMLNLARAAPVHCANTIFEVLRNRYDFYDNTY